MKNSFNGLFQSPGQDFVSGIVVFLVALPLCLGLALACEAPLISGLVAGIVGGVIIGFFSPSPLSVSGPAAGLVVIVLDSVASLGSYQAFLVATMIAGLMQVVFGLIKSGKVSLYFPSSVIKGMLAAIGLILILKQIPHLLGVDKDAIGEMEYVQKDGSTTFSFLRYAFQHISIGSALVGLATLVFLIFWDNFIIKIWPKINRVPGMLLSVLLGVGVHFFLKAYFADYSVADEHLVSLPKFEGLAQISEALPDPDYAILSNYKVYTVALTLALVASLESLLSLQAIERLDPERRTSSADTELLAQGIGNFTSGLLGGLPVTAVIVRSSANLGAGARTKLSTIMHGVLLLMAVLIFPDLLNNIPLASLAAILIMVGFKLTKPSLIKQQWKLGIYQFAPFMVTIVAIMLSDLLIGILIGIIVAFIFILYENFRFAFLYEDRGLNPETGATCITIKLSENVSFLNRLQVTKMLESLGDNHELIIDGTSSKHIDYDTLELIHQYAKNMRSEGRKVELKNIPKLKI